LQIIAACLAAMQPHFNLGQRRHQRRDNA
jgi:hypothetical protein